MVYDWNPETKKNKKEEEKMKTNLMN